MYVIAMHKDLLLSNFLMTESIQKNDNNKMSQTAVVDAFFTNIQPVACVIMHVCAISRIK